ncbi:MAG: VanZ family protein [Bacilli bacterium]
MIYLAFIAPLIIVLVNIPAQVFFIGSSIIVFFYLHICTKLFFKNDQLARLEISIIFLSYFSSLLYLLFFKNSETIDSSTLDFIPLFFSHPSFAQLTLLIGNVIMFIPIGYLSKDYKLYQSIIFIIILSFLIEAFQFIFKVGVFDLSDILLYTIGFLIGYFYALIFKKLSLSKDSLSFDLMLVFALIIIIMVISYTSMFIYFNTI